MPWRIEVSFPVSANPVGDLCLCLLLRAARAQAENIQGVTDLGKAMIIGDSLRPTLNTWPGYLDSETAVSANKMVMMPVALPAMAVDRLTILVDQHIDFPDISHGLERAIHGGEADVVTTLAQELMELLR